MKLSTLTNLLDSMHLSPKIAAYAEDPDVSGVCCRSDRVCPGDVFVALKGVNADGHDYVTGAAERGAAAVVVERPVKAGVPVIGVANARRAMAVMADALYGSPSRRMKLVGITGTNGKTTTACLLAHILKRNRFKTGVIGTIGCHFEGRVIPGSLTTPEAPDLQERLALMADAGVTHAIMEVSSHGVAQDRIFGCRFEMGIFTNLTQDHLDFHGTMDAYRAAKTGFFTNYLHNGATAVINCDTPEGMRLACGLQGTRKILTQTGPPSAGTGHGLEDHGADMDTANITGTASIVVQGENLSFDQDGITGHIRLPGGGFDFHSPLVGRFNLENILCAVAASFELGVDPEIIQASIADFAEVPGRLERVPNNASRHVFVDYSHTPDALENVLRSLRAIVPGRLICVFGCGGDRDRGKRPRMGGIAAGMADIVIVTSDNPRTELPLRIISEILEGVRLIGKTEVAPDMLINAPIDDAFAVEPDRAKAIPLGIRVSKPGDGILIAGKGHETYQIIGSTTISFDDRVHAKNALVRYGMG